MFNKFVPEYRNLQHLIIKPLMSINEFYNIASIINAVNRQPWRFLVDERSITVSTDSLKDTYHIPKRLDCGIAMLHIELGARHVGVEGRWEYLKASDVARFNV